MTPEDKDKAIEYYRAGLEKREPAWVPSRIRLQVNVQGDFPIGHLTVAKAGDHDCYSNRNGAISVIASDGSRLGIKPAEFDPLEWRKND